MLQAKLHSQEEDFRLQNSTLMAEFSKVLVPGIAEGGNGNGAPVYAWARATEAESSASRRGWTGAGAEHCPWC